MSPGKRTDYAKLDRERAAIVKDLEERQQVPQAERMQPGPLEVVRRAAQGAAQAVTQAIRESDARVRARRLGGALGTPPAQAGARVTGKKSNSSPI